MHIDPVSSPNGISDWRLDMSTIARLRLIIILTIVSVFFQGCQVVPLLIGNLAWCKYKDSLPVERREQLWKYSKNILLDLSRGELDKVYQLSHPLVQKQSTKRDLAAVVELMNQLGSLEGVNQAKLKDIIELRVRPIPQEIRPISCRAPKSSDVNTVLVFPNVDKTIMVIVDIPGHTLDRVAYFYLVEQGETLQWVAFDIHANDNNGKDAEHYYKLAQKWEARATQYPAIVAFYTARYFSDAGRNMQTSLGIETAQAQEQFQNNGQLEDELKWKINNTEYTVFDIGVVENKDGLLHYFRYLSKQPSKEKKLRTEAQRLMDYVGEHFPEVLTEFDQFAFEAYADLPTASHQQIPLGHVIFDSEKKFVKEEH